VVHIFCEARLYQLGLPARLRIYPTYYVPGSIHSWFALFDSRFALRICPQDGNLDSLPIWFSEITVRGVIFHFGGSMPPLMSSISCICAGKLTIFSHRLIILMRSSVSWVISDDGGKW